jgi:hypothetical protein
MPIHPSVGRVYRVQHIMTRPGDSALYISDLIFVGKVPTIVIEWECRPGGDYPVVTVPLDRARLLPMKAKGTDYLYEDPVSDPRRLH